MSSQYSDVFLDADVQDELYQQVGSQEISLLNGLLDGNNFIIGETLQHAIEDETTTAYDDIKNFSLSATERPLAINAIPLNEVLSNEEYEGPFAFEVSLIPNDPKTKDPWVFSSNLNKVFMDISQSFPVDFKTGNRPLDKTFLVRITPQYSAQQFAREPVLRCIQHDHPGDSTNKDIRDHVRPHVIRSLNQLAHYVGNHNEEQRLSVVLPLGVPQPGSESVREYFSFVCKSSCPSPGMNRREIEVIFTLEDETGAVFGRKSLKVRVCACPKRDKEKEEKEAEKNALNPQPGRGKKRKTDTQRDSTAGHMNRVTVDAGDSTVYNLQMQFVGRDNLLKVLNYAEDVYASKLFKNKNGPAEVVQPLQENLERIQTAKKSVMTKGHQ